MACLSSDFLQRHLLQPLPRVTRRGFLSPRRGRSKTTEGRRIISMSEITVRCPHCSAELDADESLLGRTVACPSCGQSFSAKEPSETPILKLKKGGETHTPRTTSTKKKVFWGIGIVVLLIIAIYAAFSAGQSEGYSDGYRNGRNASRDDGAAQFWGSLIGGFLGGL